MSIARGILSGFLKEGLEQKAARDEMYADMVRETGQEFRKTAALFRKDEENIEKRFKLIEEELGTPAALYASYNGLTTSDAGYNLMINAPKDFLNKLEDFDFQGYDFNTAKSSRFMDFKKQQKDSIDLITKNQGSGLVAELMFKDIQSMDTGTEVARPELDLPKMSEFVGGDGTYDIKKYYLILNQEKSLINFYKKKFKAKLVKNGFYYSSDNNKDFLDQKKLKKIISNLEF